MSHRSTKYGIKDKRSKPEVAKGDIRTQRREERALEQGRAAIAELEKRISEVQAAEKQGKRQSAPESEQMRRLVLELAEERKKVARLQFDLRTRREHTYHAMKALSELEEAPDRLQSRLETARISLDCTSSRMEQRKAVLRQLIEEQKKELVSLGMMEYAKRESPEDGTPSNDTFQESLDGLLGKLSSAWQSSTIAEPKLSFPPALLDELTALLPRDATSSASALGVTQAAFGIGVAAPAPLPGSFKTASNIDVPSSASTNAEAVCSSRGVELALARAKLGEEQRRATVAQQRLLAARKLNASSSPSLPSALVSAKVRGQENLIVQLRKTSQEHNITIKCLRDEQMELLQRLGRAQCVEEQ